MSNYSMAFDRLQRESARSADPKQEALLSELSEVQEEQVPVEASRPPEAKPPEPRSPVALAPAPGWVETPTTRSTEQRESYSALLDTIRSLRDTRGSAPFVVLAGASRAEAVDRVVAGLLEAGVRRGIRVVALELAASAGGRELRIHRVSPGGRDGLRPLEIAAPRPLEEIEAWLRGSIDRYDAVVVEAPPLSDSADGALLGRVLDGIFIVAERGRTRGDHVKVATQRARGASSLVHGLVLTQSERFLPGWLNRILGQDDS